MLERYSGKIATASQIVASKEAGSTVILCHGVFDVVHPGHVRHLIYAKSKADILVVGITADRFVKKGNHRPHVPQDLRALNLAAFEMVDHVVIDDHETPLELISELRPDYFAKGFEYSGTGAATAAEVTAVSAYGGEVIFTPGDIVYSSSKLIEMSPPDIRLPKLHSLMQRSGVTFDRLHRIVDGMQGKPAHVLGDTIVDSVTHGNVIGASSKTPTLSVQIESKEHFVGGAAIVAKHMRAAGASVTFSTVIGDDAMGEFVINDIDGLGIECAHEVDLARPTTCKNAVVAGGYRLLKLDTVDNRPISDRIVTNLCENLSEVKGGAVVFSDFRHGIFNRTTIAKLLSAVPKWALTAADSQVASRWGNILDFAGCDLLTPNEKEARFALGDQESGVRMLAWELYRQAKCKLLLLKLGERGLLAKDAGDGFTLDSFAQRAVDPVGAGDALLAYATLSMLVEDKPEAAGILGGIAAAVACENDGNWPVSCEEVHNRIDELQKELA